MRQRSARRASNASISVNNNNNNTTGGKDTISSLDDSTVPVNEAVLCQKKSKSIKNLVAKSTSIDSNNQSSNDSSNNVINNSTKKKKKKKKEYICSICKKRFLGSSDLSKHERIHSDDRPFKCEHCTKRFRQAVCLKNHIASIHGTDQPFQCDHCPKSFPIKERLRLHMRIHTGEKPYKCNLCGKAFGRGGQLKQHRLVHNGAKDFKCDQCPNFFSTATNLRLHMKLHQDDREYLCNICEKKFNRPDSLRKHLLSFHANVKSFHCDVCNKTLRGHLPQHMRLHQNIRPFGCSLCGATFSQKSQLNVHQRTHSGERPYRCQVCWQAFAHSSVLKLHIRKHTGEKPFKCQICMDKGTAFSQLPHLKTHMRTIHGQDKPYMCELCHEFLKTKNDYQIHNRQCVRLKSELDPWTEKAKSLIEKEKAALLSKLRLMVAVLLKKISTKERLKQLGFEKRLIDNVIVSALKVAGRSYCEDPELEEIESFKANIKLFLEWTIPENFMSKFREENKSIENLLEDLCASYSRVKYVK